MQFESRGVVVWSALAALAAVAAPSAKAQDYPTRPVRFVVPYVPGGGVDFVGRTLAQKLSESWAQLCHCR